MKHILEMQLADNVKAHVLLAISLTGGSSWQGVRAIG